MIVFSNHRLGAAAELLVSADVAQDMLCATAEAARATAAARWEHELVRWLEGHSGALARAGYHGGFDVEDIAWTPEHFERQRRFLLDAIDRAAAGSSHARALTRWYRMIEAHPRDSVQFGRRWNWHVTA